MSVVALLAELDLTQNASGRTLAAFARIDEAQIARYCSDVTVLPGEAIPALAGFKRVLVCGRSLASRVGLPADVAYLRWLQRGNTLMAVLPDLHYDSLLEVPDLADRLRFFIRRLCATIERERVNAA